MTVFNQRDIEWFELLFEHFNGVFFTGVLLGVTYSDDVFNFIFDYIINTVDEFQLNDKAISNLFKIISDPTIIQYLYTHIPHKYHPPLDYLANNKYKECWKQYYIVEIEKILDYYFPLGHMILEYIF